MKHAIMCVKNIMQDKTQLFLFGTAEIYLMHLTGVGSGVGRRDGKKVGEEVGLKVGEGNGFGVGRACGKHNSKRQHELFLIRNHTCIKIKDSYGVR